MTSKRKFLVLPLIVTAVIALLALPRVGLQAQDATATATAAIPEATQPAATENAAPATKTQIVADANAFIALLDDTQKAAVMFDFNDTAQRTNWSNFPTGAYNRAGLEYGLMNETQQAAIMKLLREVLSADGYQKVIDIMTGDEVLGQTENSGSTGGGAGAYFGYGYYFVSFLGTPSETDPWIMQWGGHHLALNITFAGADEILTPTHTGCQPCSYFANDQQVYVLGDEYAKGLKLVNALDADQQATAILDYSVTDLVEGPGEEDRALEPEGLPASQMTDDQKTLLLDVINEWVGIANESAAAARMAEIKSTLDQTYFAWSGDTGPTSQSYFRITGPTILIEYAPQGTGNVNAAAGGTGGGNANFTPPADFTPGQGGPNGTEQAGGGGPILNNASTTAVPNSYSLDLGSFGIIPDAVNHVHTIYRDPTNAYGAAATAP